MDYSAYLKTMAIKVVAPIKKSVVAAKIGRENREKVGIPSSFALRSLCTC